MRAAFIHLFFVRLLLYCCYEPTLFVVQPSYESDECFNEPTPQPVSCQSDMPANFESLKNASGQFEVYVSAIASPARFWIQLVGPQIAKLERLIDEMTEYYENVENQTLHRIDNAYLGQIVAAKFNFDGKWYQAEIVGIEPNQYNPRNVVLDVYFLDYGDSMYVHPNEVFEMRTDFLTLRYQAIECFLANLLPMYPIDNERWNNSAINRFEEITHVAKWKKLIAKIITTRERVRGGGDVNQVIGSPIPGIELYDIVEDREVNLASTLILENFAVPTNHLCVETPLSRYSSSENVLRLDGGSSQNSSVAEKAMMFELQANLQLSGGSSPKSNHGISNSQPSPKVKSSPRKNRHANEKENNGNIQNISQANESNGSNQPNLLGNRSWAEIMEAESENVR